MNKQVTILDQDNKEHLVNVNYSIITPEIIVGGEDYPIYVDDEENSYIEINEVTGNLPSNFNDYKEDYEQDIIELL